MSHDAAHHSAPAAPPQAPILTARANRERGTIRTRGRIDRLGADLLCGLAGTLRDCGHRHITVQLSGATTVDPEAAPVLDTLADHLAAGGGRLTVAA